MTVEELMLLLEDCDPEDEVVVISRSSPYQHYEVIDEVQTTAIHELPGTKVALWTEEP